MWSHHVVFVHVFWYSALPIEILPIAFDTLLGDTPNITTTAQTRLPYQNELATFAGYQVSLNRSHSGKILHETQTYRGAFIWLYLLKVFYENQSPIL